MQTQPAFQVYQHEFARHLRNPLAFRPPQRVDEKRIGVYVKLLRNKFEDSLQSCFPIASRLLGTRRWNRLVMQFIARHACVSPFYRQIPDEFLRFLWNERSDASDPPFLNELAHYEWMELSLAIAKDEPVERAIETNGDLLENRPVFNPVMHLHRYVYPVHRIAPDEKSWRKWQSWRLQPTGGLLETSFILGFRDNEGGVHFNEINAAVAKLIELLVEGGLSGKTALMRLAEEMNAPNPDAIIAFGLQSLSKLREEGAILGTRSIDLESS
jgi:hypothetical protein